MTYPPPGEQPYTQPQDPWSGSQGIASAPTDPLPQPVRGQFTPGVAAPSAWSQETIAHSDPYVPAGEGGGRAGLYVLVVLLVIVLGGAGGFGAWWAITNYAGDLGLNPPTTTTPTTTGQQSPTPTPTEMKFTPEIIAVGDCMINRNPDVNPPDMYKAPCDRENAFQVLKIFSGAEAIPEGPSGNFTEEDTANVLCADLDSDSWFGWNSSNDAQDRFYCMTTDVRVS